MDELADTCDVFMGKVNGRVHQATPRPDDALQVERGYLHPVPVEPHTAALGQARIVASDQTVSFGSVRNSVPVSPGSPTRWPEARLGHETHNSKERRCSLGDLLHRVRPSNLSRGGSIPPWGHSLLGRIGSGDRLRRSGGDGGRGPRAGSRR